MSGLILQLAFVTSVAAAPLISGAPRVSDGDTLRFGPVVVRLHGIDAPESGQSCASAGGGSWACGLAATRRLEALIAGKAVTCEALDRDRYGRVVARCEASGEDLGAAMVSDGLAWAYIAYSDAYIPQQTLAQAGGHGIWAAPSQPAWEFRAARWRAADQDTPLEGCPIKGNISKSGERIYHLPWSPAYAKTVIREDQGERWFCDEAEAQAAGWRPARWK